MSTDQETLLEFPCTFPIKVMGDNHPDFETTVVEIVRRHAPDLEETAITRRPSKGNKFLAVTLTITARSKPQLDAIYLELTACSLVKMAL